MIFGINSCISLMNQEYEQFLVRFTGIVQKTIDYAHEKILIRTPVWSGETIRNYHWSMNSARGGGLLPALGSGDPGPTNSMPLGAEPRRGINVSRVNLEKSEMKVTTKNVFSNFIMYNFHPKAELLEFGDLPTPQTSRSPGGMVRLTESELATMLPGMTRI